jgi:hypothetical protein
MTGAHLPPSPIPEPRPDDDDDVSWKLQTAAVEWRRAAYDDAVTWLRRAAEAAIELEQWSRGADLNAAASRIAKTMPTGGSQSAPPPGGGSQSVPPHGGGSSQSVPPYGGGSQSAPPPSPAPEPVLPSFDSPSLAGLSFPSIGGLSRPASVPPSIGSLPSASGRRSDSPQARRTSSGPPSIGGLDRPYDRSSIVIDVDEDEVDLTDDEIMELEREERGPSRRPSSSRVPARAPVESSEDVLPSFSLEASRPLWKDLPPSPPPPPPPPEEEVAAPSSLPSFALEMTAAPPEGEVAGPHREALPSYLGAPTESVRSYADPLPSYLSPTQTAGADLPSFTLDTEVGRLPPVAPSSPPRQRSIPAPPPLGTASRPFHPTAYSGDVDDHSVPGITEDELSSVPRRSSGAPAPESTGPVEIEAELISETSEELELDSGVQAELELEDDLELVSESGMAEPSVRPEADASPELRSSSIPKAPESPKDLAPPSGTRPPSTVARGESTSVPPRSSRSAQVPRPVFEPVSDERDIPTTEASSGYRAPAGSISDEPPPPRGTPIASFFHPTSDAPASARGGATEPPASVRSTRGGTSEPTPVSVRSTRGGTSEPPASVRSTRGGAADAGRIPAVVEPTVDEPPASLPPVVSRDSHAPASAEEPLGEVGLVEGVDLSEVRGLQDLPSSARRILSRRARIEQLAAGEEVCFFAVALVVRGWVSLMPAIVDAACASAVVGEVVFTEGTLAEGVALRAVAGENGTRVAVWDSHALVEATVDCPALLDDLRLMADGFQALAGASLGPIGERLDDALRSMVTARCEVRALSSGETLVEGGRPVPGLHIIGGGEVELVDRDGKVLSTHGAGEFLFSAQVLAGGPAPCTARAAGSGALVLFAPRMVAHELLVSVPPLLELLGE